MSQTEPELTNHALLVLWGQFAQQIGLTAALQAIPLHQKTCTHSPQTKTIEFLVAILGGLSYLKDFSKAAHPIVKDQAVAQAWGQGAWADYSGVSRTLNTLTLEEARQIVEALETVAQGFIDREINLALLQSEGLVLET